jgi:hypothetical protein
MRELRRYSLLRISAWLIVAIVMILIFSDKDTILMWGDNKTKTILLAVLIAFGLGSDLIIRSVINKKGLIKDDYKNQKAINIGLIATLIYVFTASIVLYTYFENSGLVSVGWLWFLAYSTIVFVNVAVGISCLFNEKRR